MQERGKWKGNFTLWSGGGGYVGTSSDTKVHAHHAIQLCFALEGSFNLRSSPSRKWEAFSAALVAPDAPHQLDGSGHRIVLVYLDPESEAASRIRTRFTDAAIQPVPVQTLSPLLEKIYTEAGPQADLIPLFNAMVTSLGGEASVPGSMDPRIAQATRLLNSSAEAIPTLRELAQKVHLSPSRLGHLFRAQTGLPLRCYRLWLRLRRALDALNQTGSLTTAAHSAAFADSAHFSRTFRRMFGITPSELAVERQTQPSRSYAPR
ncbi:MAG: helix-turn-helix transcriptional regulator [Acidobacteria bacterium]|nr:helix-turn-helix transcriptional regulator [Acidobacteriota bacterium]